MVDTSDGSRRKLIEFDAETWHALQLLARESMKSVQELADEAFADLLRKYGRPVTLKEALRESARRIPANDPEGPAIESAAGKKKPAKKRTPKQSHRRRVLGRRPVE